MVRLNRTHYSLLKIFTGKIFNFSKLSHQVKFQRITQIPHNSPTQSANYAKFAHFVNISYLCFRHLPRQRTLQNSSELRKFHAIRPHSPRMTRNSHHLFTLYICCRCLTSGRERRKIPVNQVKFARFAPIHHELREFRALRTKINTYVIDFQISDHRQRNQENLSESTKFRSIRHLLRELREFCAFRNKLIHV